MVRPIYIRSQTSLACKIISIIAHPKLPLHLSIIGVYSSMDYRHSHFHFEAKHIGDKTVLIASYCKFSFFLWLPLSLEVLVFANSGERKITRSWRICWCSRSLLQTLNYPTSPFSLKVVVYCQLWGENDDEKEEDLGRLVLVADTQLSSIQPSSLLLSMT